MKILLTGATGYIAKRLLPFLAKDGHAVVCAVRDRERFVPCSSLQPFIEVIEVDFLKPKTLDKIPKDIDVAYYLIHSMSNNNDYKTLEANAAHHFVKAVSNTQIKQVIYLSGIVNADFLSEHLQSRKNVESILSTGDYALTTLRSGIIIGSGSASFEIIRDLVEKLPVMIAPQWLNTKCQPIGIKDVLFFLQACLLEPKVYHQSYDIGGSEVLTYKEMLLRLAQFRNLKRYIYTVPIMTPKFSSYWLYFMTSTSYSLARSLVGSMGVEVICKDRRILDVFNVETEGYHKTLQRAFKRIASKDLLSSWKDAHISGVSNFSISDFLEVPNFGCFKDRQVIRFANRAQVIANIWSIGGETGWYYANFLWKLRGFLDRLCGGVGLRRGRTNPHTLNVGDALDFWRVLYADKEEGVLLLFAEMKLPGEAWLEFKIVNNRLLQTATFRPRGIFGRLYWYSVIPFHLFIFKGLIKALARNK